MAFFFKKNGAETPEADLGKSPIPVPERMPVAAKEISVPSAEGLAIAQRLSGQRTAVPAGFKVRADHFQIGGGCLIAGELEGRVVGYGRNEILPGGVVSGDLLGDELSVKGLLTGRGSIDRLTIQPGGECRGSFRGNSLILSDGGVFDGEYSRSRS